MVIVVLFRILQSLTVRRHIRAVSAEKPLLTVTGPVKLVIDPTNIKRNVPVTFGWIRGIATASNACYPEEFRLWVVLLTEELTDCSTLVKRRKVTGKQETARIKTRFPSLQTPAPA